MLRDIFEAWTIVSRDTYSDYNDVIGRGPLDGVPDPEMPAPERFSFSGGKGKGQTFFDMYLDGTWIGAVQYKGSRKDWMKDDGRPDRRRDTDGPADMPWSWYIDVDPIDLEGAASTPREAVLALLGFQPLIKDSVSMRKHTSDIKDYGDGTNRTKIHALLGLPAPEFADKDWRSKDKGSEDWSQRLESAMAELGFVEDTTPQQKKNKTRTFYKDFTKTTRVGLGLFRLNDAGVSNYIRVRTYDAHTKKHIFNYKTRETELRVPDPSDWQMYGRNLDVDEAMEKFKQYLRNKRLA